MNTDKFVLPVIGQEIYIPTALHISNGSDDVHGGLAKISKIETSKTLPEDHYNYCFVSVEEVPGTGYNYKSLLEQQDELKEEFGKTRAYPDPDEDTPWIEDGDSVNGEIWRGGDVW